MTFTHHKSHDREHQEISKEEGLRTNIATHRPHHQRRLGSTIMLLAKKAREMVVNMRNMAQENAIMQIHDQKRY